MHGFFGKYELFELRLWGYHYLYSFDLN